MRSSMETILDPFETYDEYQVEKWEFVLPSGHCENVVIVTGKDEITLTEDKAYQVFNLRESGATIRVPLAGTLVRHQQDTIKARRKKLDECKVCTAKAVEGDKFCKRHGGGERAEA